MSPEARRRTSRNSGSLEEWREANFDEAIRDLVEITRARRQETSTPPGSMLSGATCPHACPEGLGAAGEVLEPYCLPVLPAEEKVAAGEAKKELEVAHVLFFRLFAPPLAKLALEELPGQVAAA